MLKISTTFLAAYHLETICIITMNSISAVLNKFANYIDIAIKIP